MKNLIEKNQETHAFTMQSLSALGWEFGEYSDLADDYHAVVSIDHENRKAEFCIFPDTMTDGASTEWFTCDYGMVIADLPNADHCDSDYFTL